MIAVIDYGVGNLFSLAGSLRYIGAEIKVTAKRREIEDSSAVILPGVGAFGDAYARLEECGLVDVLLSQARSGKPMLGICLGMQMLFDQSEEFGSWQGLGLVPGKVVCIPAEAADGACQEMPHIGWEGLLPAGGRADFAGTVLSGVRPGGECYFIHSYEAKPADEADRLADAMYGGRRV